MRARASLATAPGSTRGRPPRIFVSARACTRLAPPPRAAAATTAELDALCSELLALRAKGDASDPSDAAVAAAAADLEAKAAAAGASLDRAHVSGVFQGHTLTGRNVKATSGAMPLGALSFGCYASPPGALVRISGGGDAPSRILRGGERFGVGPEAYVLSTAFEVVALPAESESGGGGGEGAGGEQQQPPPPPPRAIRGMSHAVARGSWSSDPDTPSRMDLHFAAMVLEPLPGMDLGDWLAAFGPPVNQAMDCATGRLRVPLEAAKAPQGWIDHLLTTPSHTLIRGNFGSVSLLVRAEGE